jgi:hypothetical protein
MSYPILDCLCFIREFRCLKPWHRDRDLPPIMYLWEKVSRPVDDDKAELTRVVTAYGRRVPLSGQSKLFPQSCTWLLLASHTGHRDKFAQLVTRCRLLVHSHTGLYVGIPCKLLGRLEWMILAPILASRRQIAKAGRDYKTPIRRVCVAVVQDLSRARR